MGHHYLWQNQKQLHPDTSIVGRIPSQCENSQEKSCVKVFVLSLILVVILTSLVLFLADSAERNLYNQNNKNEGRNVEILHVGGEGDSVWIRALRISDLIPLKSRKKRFLTQVAENLNLAKPATNKPSKDEDKKSGSKRPKEKKSKSKPSVPEAPPSPKQSNPFANAVSSVFGGSVLQGDKIKNAELSKVNIDNSNKQQNNTPPTNTTISKPDNNSVITTAKPVNSITTSRSLTEQKITSPSSLTNKPATVSSLRNSTDSGPVVEKSAHNSTTIRAYLNHTTAMPNSIISSYNIATPVEPVRDQKQEAEEENMKISSKDEDNSEDALSKETDITNNQSSDDKDKTLHIATNLDDSDLADNSVTSDHVHPSISASAMDAEIHWRHQNINTEPEKLPFTIWSPNQDFHFHRFINKEGVASDSESSSSSEEKREKENLGNGESMNHSNKTYHFHRFRNNETTSLEFTGSSSEEVEDEIEKVIRESSRNTQG